MSLAVKPEILGAWVISERVFKAWSAHLKKGGASIPSNLKPRSEEEAISDLEAWQFVESVIEREVPMVKTLSGKFVKDFRRIKETRDALTLCVGIETVSQTPNRLRDLIIWEVAQTW